MKELKGLYSNKNGDIFKLKEYLPTGGAIFCQMDWLHGKGWFAYEKTVYMSDSDIAELKKH